MSGPDGRAGYDAESEAGHEARCRARAERAAYRAFVRRHHPDRGGDVDTFVDGLARMRREGRAAPPDQVRDRSADRYDAPVVGVVRPRGVRAVVVRVRRWWLRRARKPRVR